MSNTTSKQSKAVTLAHVQALIAGTNKHFPNGSFTLGSTAYTTSSLVQLFQSVLDAMAAQNAAQASAKDSVASTRAIKAKVDPVILIYQRFLLTMFTDETKTLADFGLAPRKAPAPKTAQQKAAAAAKARATRTARGTTSKKQKLAIKGDVTGITVTPVISPIPAPSPPVPTTSK